MITANVKLAVANAQHQQDRAEEKSSFTTAAWTTIFARERLPLSSGLPVFSEVIISVSRYPLVLAPFAI